MSLDLLLQIRKRSVPAVVPKACTAVASAVQDACSAQAELTSQERSSAKQKTEAVAEWARLRRQGLTRDGATAALIVNEGAYPLIAGKIKTTNLEKWLRKLGKKRDGTPNIANYTALAPRYRQGCMVRSNRHAINATFLQFFYKLYLHQNRLPMSQAYYNACLLARQDGVPEAEIPSRDQVRYHLKRKVSPRVLAHGRETASKYADGHGGYILRDWDCEVGEVWIGDHRILDMWVRVPDPRHEGQWVAQRPWMTAWLDAKSGYLVSALIYVDSYPNHRKILESLYRGIVHADNVPPRVLYTDNGKDYLKGGAIQDLVVLDPAPTISQKNKKITLVESVMGEAIYKSDDATTGYTHSIARELGCEFKLSRPYNGREKPIERCFRDFAQGFDRLWHGYTGNTPGNRPDYGTEFSGNLHRLPSIEQVIAKFGEWVTTTYHTKPNNSRRTGGIAPVEAWQNRKPLRQPLGDHELQYAMLLPQPRAVVVRRGPTGANIQYDGWPYMGIDANSSVKLRDYYRKRVMIKTNWSIMPTITAAKKIHAKIWVYTLDGQLICEAIPVPTISVFGKSPQKTKELGEAMHAAAAIRLADRLEKQTLTGSTRIMAPGTYIGLPTGETDTTPAPPHLTAPTIQPSLAHGNGRGKTKIIPHTQPTDQLGADPQDMALLEDIINNQNKELDDDF